MNVCHLYNNNHACYFLQLSNQLVKYLLESGFSLCTDDVFYRAIFQDVQIVQDVCYMQFCDHVSITTVVGDTGTTCNTTNKYVTLHYIRVL